MALKLIGIGGLGLMLSPSAKHLTPSKGVRFIRIHDRGVQDARKAQFRDAWKVHGARLVSTFEELIGEGDFDGVVICVGKNGDDLEILKTFVPLLHQRCSHRPFILHFSTVSTRFVEAAHGYCQSFQMEYGNYPLTGGPAGAEQGTMLILASGSEALYRKAESYLMAIGKPKYFGTRITAGAEVKLIGHYLVFNGLIGISSAVGLQLECFGGNLGNEDQIAFFDFLNQGSGGTRQWEVVMKRGIRDHVWDQGFLIPHAVVDTLYAAQLGFERGASAFAILPILTMTLALTYVLKHYPHQRLATHAIVRELLKQNRAAFDDFFLEHLCLPDLQACLQRCVTLLPEDIQSKVMLTIEPNVFKE